MMKGSPVRVMYCRPGSLYKDFWIYKKKQKIVGSGTPVTKFERVYKVLSGVLADADTNQNDRKKHLWDQDQHTLTHTMVSPGGPKAKGGDAMVYKNRLFLVLLADNAADLGISTIYYLEERNDIDGFSRCDTECC